MMAPPKRVPAHLIIRTKLKAEILDGKHVELSESQLIQRFKVSSATARRVLNDLSHEGLVSRQVGRGSIVRQPADRAFREFGVVFFDVFDSTERFIAEIVHGIEERARPQKHHLHLFTTRGRQVDDDGLSSLSCLVTRRKINGVFVLSPLGAAAIRFFLAERLPCVCVGNHYPGLRAPAVIFDSRQAMLDACRRLSQNGRRRIAAIVRRNTQTGVERTCDFIARAYYEYYASQKLRPQLSWWQALADESAEGIGAMRALYNLPPEQRPEAVVVNGLNLSAGVADFLEQCRDWRPAPVYFADRLAANANLITAPYRKQGRVAFDLMEELLSGPRKRASPAPMLLPMELHWHQADGAAAQ